MTEELFTVETAAEYFKVSPKTIHNFIRDGILEGFKAGRDWRFTAADLKEAQERLRKRTTKRHTDPEHKAVEPSAKEDEDRELVYTR